MQRLREFGRWIWPRRDPLLWQLTGSDRKIKTRIILAIFLAPIAGFLELVFLGLALEASDNPSSVFFVSGIVGAIAGTILLAAGFLFAREFLVRHRGAVFVAVAGTLVYVPALLVTLPFSGIMLMAYWPVSPGFGALYALDLYLLLRLLLHPYRDLFWPRSGTATRQPE